MNPIPGRPAQNDEKSGARILGNEEYTPYAAITKDEALRRRRNPDRVFQQPDTNVPRVVPIFGSGIVKTPAAPVHAL